jgi:hypothetical protein
MVLHLMREVRFAAHLFLHIFKNLLVFAILVKSRKEVFLLLTLVAYATGAIVLSNKPTIVGAAPGFSAPYLEKGLSPLLFLGIAVVLLIITMIVYKR